ncbi:MATE efflux family protein [Coniophora puteana RWD-64-598 SS2]|uniref:MATE efflux family protein n=1 Tax=Coniophora puteana (strain RWD-64-598) TaxID=741705 RepID=A0A5M3M6Z4_CONPW|nr:MATE efflux family protein [Coniophora puteana RWD-64-598 SS2]EIW75122.1 MATE efflux family protein [Coniophora puteana RWD-64-598 SS2]
MSPDHDNVDERTPLLHEENALNGEIESRKSGVRLLTSLAVDSIPVILSYILQNSVQTTSVLITGKLGPEELSAAAFSVMLAYVTGWCIALGGGSALDTLGSQAFTGGSRASDLSIHFQRCVIVLWCLFIPVGFLWTFIGDVLLAIKEPPVLCANVQRILRILIIGAPGYIAFESLKKYLQCQGIMRASTWVLVIMTPINIVLHIYLIHFTTLGLLGCPLALSITYWMAFFLLVIFTTLSPAHKRNGTWEGLQLRAALNPKGCWSFLKLAVPGILMVGTEWAAFEIVALAAGRLGGLPLAAQSVIMTTDQIVSTLPFGFGVVASNRIGNLLGAKAAVGAKRAAHAAALLSVIVMSIVMVIMLLSRNQFGYIYSDDEDVVRLVSKVMPLVASFQIADGLANSCGGILRGQGRQHLGALFNIVAYYIIALPIGISLAFKTPLGLQGLWIGQVIGLFTVGIGEYGVVWLGTNWNLEVEKGIKRNEEEAKRHDVQVPASHLAHGDPTLDQGPSETP